jgi:hypothetical protein
LDHHTIKGRSSQQTPAGYSEIADAPSRADRIPRPAIVSRFKDVDGETACDQYTMIVLIKVDRLYIGKVQRGNLLPGIASVSAAEKSGSCSEPDIAGVINSNRVDGKIGGQCFCGQPAFASTD